MRKTERQIKTRPLAIMSEDGLPPSPLKGVLTPLSDPQEGKPLSVVRSFHVENNGSYTVEDKEVRLHLHAEPGTNSLHYLGAKIVKDIAWPILEATHEPVFCKSIDRLLRAQSHLARQQLYRDKGLSRDHRISYTVHETEIGALFVSEEAGLIADAIQEKKWHVLNSHIFFLWRSPQSNHAQLGHAPQLEGIVDLANKELDLFGIPPSQLLFTLR